MEITDLSILPFPMMQLPFSFCRLKLHYASYEPTIRVLHEKHHALLKEKMLTSLEKDRAVGKVRKEAVKTTLKPLLIILYCACDCICVHMYFCVRSVCSHMCILCGGQRTLFYSQMCWARSLSGLEPIKCARLVDPRHFPVFLPPVLGLQLCATIMNVFIGGVNSSFWGKQFVNWAVSPTLSHLFFLWVQEWFCFLR